MFTWLHLSDQKSVIHLEVELELWWSQDDDVRSSAEVHSRYEGSNKWSWIDRFESRCAAMFSWLDPGKVTWEFSWPRRTSRRSKSEGISFLCSYQLPIKWWNELLFTSEWSAVTSALSCFNMGHVWHDGLRQTSSTDYPGLIARNLIKLQLRRGRNLYSSYFSHQTQNNG